MEGFILLIIFITCLFIVGALVISSKSKNNTKDRKENSTFIPPNFIGDSHNKNDHHDSSDGHGGDFGGGDGGGSGGD